MTQIPRIRLVINTYRSDIRVIRVIRGVRFICDIGSFIRRRRTLGPRITRIE